MSKYGRHITRLFVYGTLKTENRNWTHLLTPRRGKRVAVLGHTVHDCGAFPMMTASDNRTDIVWGEVFKIHTGELDRLDIHEGYVGPGRDNLYERVVVTLTDGGEAWAYVSKYADAYPRVVDGRWEPRPCPVCNRGYIRRCEDEGTVLYIHEVGRGHWPTAFCVWTE